MAKDIVLLFDGTGNAVEVNQTNILKLYRCLKKDDGQVVYYIPGIGTFGGDDWWSGLARNVIHVFGLTTGWGLDRTILDGYAFLCDHYEERVVGRRAEDDNGDSDDDPDDDDDSPAAAERSRHIERDRIWIFGFSRGAYTARALAGFINVVGLLDTLQKPIAFQALTAFKRKAGVFEALRPYAQTFRVRRPPIHFMGLFDTVSTVFAPRPDRIIPQFHELPYTSKNPSVRAVRHALAIDEHRAFFRCSLWKEGENYHGGPFTSAPGVPQDVKQVWFSGVHCDIGGGYPEQSSGLSKITLKWMIDEIKATEHQLRFVTQTVNQVVEGKPRAGGLSFAKPDAGAELHKSMNFGWSLTELIPNRVSAVTWPSRPRFGGFYWPLFAPRLISGDASIHQSVRDRQALRPDYRPDNLPA